MLAWLRRLLAWGGRSAPPSVAADQTGITLTHGRRSRAVPWRTVSRITALKYDLGTSTRIVLLVEAEVSGDPVITIPEECPGFAGLFGPMEAELGLNPEGYLQSMPPAREPVPTVLYIRDIEASDRADNEA